MKLRSLLPAIVGLGVVATLAACGPDTATSRTGGTGGGAPAPATSSAPAKTGALQVMKVAQVDGFAPFVTNEKGRTVYRFDQDKANPPTTTCVDKCAETWQPMLAPDGVEVREGIDESQVGTIERPDGGKQLTLKGWPLYYFKDDLALGQTAGQGKGGTWFAIAPDGSKAAQTGRTGGAAPQPGASTGTGAKQILKVGQVNGFAPFVINEKGRTVYRFDQDKTNPPTTTCVGACAKTWEPVLAPNGFEIREGINKNLVGVIVRPDGGKQLTLKGWPLYYFKDDLKLGQTAGQGKGGTWFAIAPDGSKAAQTGGATGGSGGGYGK
jgi:predicted lipoprotein with Yx(FWY)xxD motif